MTVRNTVLGGTVGVGVATGMEWCIVKLRTCAGAECQFFRLKAVAPRSIEQAAGPSTTRLLWVASRRNCWDTRATLMP